MLKLGREGGRGAEKGGGRKGESAGLLVMGLIERLKE